jgi:hypothetical protein
MYRDYLLISIQMGQIHKSLKKEGSEFERQIFLNSVQLPVLLSKAKAIHDVCIWIVGVRICSLPVLNKYIITFSVTSIELTYNVSSNSPVWCRWNFS